MAVRINASGEYLRRTASLPSYNAFTMCGWSKITRRASQYQYWGLENAVSSSSEWLLMGFQPTGELEISRSGGSGAFSSSPTSETWFFWALLCEGVGTNQFRGYWAYLTDTSFKTAQDTLGVGGDFTVALMSLGNDSYDEYCNANFSNVKVWDAVLTEAELWNEMRSIVPVRLANLHIWSPLWTAGDVQDYSGNGRDWTTGGTLTSEDHPPIAYGLPMWVMPTASAAGTNYEQSAAGSLTPSGVIVRKPAKVLAGSIAPTGALSRQAGKVAAGSLAPSGVLSRMAGKILSGALAPSGALQTAIIKAVSIAGSLGLAGALSRMAGKALSGGVAPSGGVTRQAGKTLSGSITPTGAASRQTSKSLAGSITPSGALNTAVVRLLSLAGSLGLAGGLVRRTDKDIAGGMSPSGALVRQIGKSLAGDLTPAGALVADFIGGVIQVAVSGTLALSGALSRATSKGLAGVLTPAGGIAKRINKSIAGALSLAGALVRQLLNIPIPASRIHAINGEDRAFAIVHEDRAFAVLGEDRTLAIGE